MENIWTAHHIYLGLELVVNFLNHAVWPILIVVLLIVFRKTIHRLLENLPELLNKRDVSLSVGSFSIGWSTIEAIVNSDNTDKDMSLTDDIRSQSTLESILKSWLNLENILQSRVSQLHGIKDNVRGWIRCVRILKNEGIITEETYRVICELGQMRNNIVHGDIEIDSLTVDNARYFKRAIDMVIKKIDQNDSGDWIQTSLFDSQ